MLERHIHVTGGVNIPGLVSVTEESLVTPCFNELK